MIGAIADRFELRAAVEVMAITVAVSISAIVSTASFAARIAGATGPDR
jgi:hypothetical protein